MTSDAPNSDAPGPVILAYDYPPNDGGISRLGAGLAEELTRRGQPPRVVTLRGTEAAGLARPGGPITEVSPGRGRREFETLRALRALPASTPVIATVWNPEATLALLAGRRRLTILAHGNEVMAYDGKPLKARVRRAVLGAAPCVVCNSRHTEALVRAAAPTARTVVIRPAVDADRFRHPGGKAAARCQLGLPEDARVVLSVSRLAPMKGHDTVLRAIARLPEVARAGLCYAIVGKGGHRAALERMARDLGIAANLRFVGFVPDAALPAWYAAADLFALCSRADPAARAVEGFGMVFAEAQAAGTPVLGTRSGGIPDAVAEGDGGWLVAEGDDAAVARYLQALCDDPDAFAEEGFKGRARVLRELTWRAYVDALLDVL